MRQLLLFSFLLLFSVTVFANEFWEGSGEFINNKGELLTASHVVHNAIAIEVIYHDKVYFATVIADDPKVDLAVIKIGATNTPYILLAPQDYVISKKLTSVGFPLGDLLDSSVVKHIADAYIGHDPVIPDMLLYQGAMVCGGQSGGSLLNSNNNLVGVSLARLTAYPDLYDPDHCSTVGDARDIQTIQGFLDINIINYTVSKNNNFTHIYDDMFVYIMVETK